MGQPLYHRLRAAIINSGMKLQEISELPNYWSLEGNWKRALEIQDEVLRQLKGANLEIDLCVSEHEKR